MLTTQKKYYWKNLDNIFIFLLFFLTILYLMSFLGFDLRFMLGNFGDDRLNNYFLEHGYQYVLGNHASFWSAPFYYPAQNVMTYSDTHIGTLLLYVPFRFIGFDIESSFQLWIISIFILNSLSAYVVFRWLSLSSFSSMVGAILFSLSAIVIMKTGHIQLIPRFMIPFLFYAVVKFVQTLDIKYYYLLLFSFVYQMYTGIYIGFFALIGLVVTLPLIGYFVYKNESIEKLLVKSNVIKMIFSTIIAVFFLYLLFSPYIEYKEASGGRSFSEILSMLPRLESWFFTTGSIIPILNTVGSRLPMAHEHVMFLGFLTYAAFFVAVIYYIKIMNQVSLHKIKNHFMVLWSLVMICSIFIVTIVVGDHYTLYKNTIYLLPGLDAIRAVTRINLFLLFPFAFLVAFLIDRFESSTEVKRVIKFFALFFLLVLFVVEQYRSNESISHYSKNESQQRYFFIKDMIKNIDENYDLIYLIRDKTSSMFYEDELDAMYLGLMVNKPVINGYSGNIPNAYELWNNNNYQKWVVQNFSQFKDKKMLIVENDVIWRIEDLNSLASFKVTASTKQLDDFSFKMILEPVYQGNKIKIKVINDSKSYWSSLYYGKYGLAFSYNILDSSANLDFKPRVMLPFDVSSGEAVLIEFDIQGLSIGKNTVCFNMVQDGVKWFSEPEKNCTEVVIE